MTIEKKKGRRSGQVLVPNAERARLKNSGKDPKDYRGDKWLVRIFLGYKADGKPHYHNETIHGTKAQAEEWLRAALVRIDRDEPIKDPDIFLSELFEEFLSLKTDKRSAKTLEVYQSYFDSYIKPKFGDLKISILTSREIQKWVSDMLKAGYAADTIRLAYATLRAPINYALNHGILHKDPLRGVEVPGKGKRKGNVLLPEEALKVLEASRRIPGGIYCEFLIWSGARPNEACALQWKDIDWTNSGANDGKGRVSIERNLVRALKGGDWRFEDPKTEAGKRSFTLPIEFMEGLREHRILQLEQRLKMGKYWQDLDLVFPNETGSVLSRYAYPKIWHEILEAAGVSEERRKMRPYDTRHSMATLLLLQRTPTKIVSAWLGHSSTTITEDIYSHILNRMQDEATDDLVEAIYGRKKEKKS